MNIGNKIKRLRISNGITQSQLCGNQITRNMLSAIEGGKATPSLETLVFLANRLSVPASFLISDNDDLFIFEKITKIDEIRSNFADKKYDKCVSMIESLSGADDETNYLLAYSLLYLGKESLINGSLISAKKFLKKSKNACDKTLYDTKVINALIVLYSAIAENIQSPLLVLDSDTYFSEIKELSDFEFFSYVKSDKNFSYTNQIYARHVNAKELIKSQRYYEAVSELTAIDNERSPKNYNAFFVLALYNDLELCYKQLGNYEMAYRYACKKMSLLEAFKS